MNFLKKVSTALSLLAGLALAACENVVEVPMPEHKPKLAIRYMLGNDTPDSAFYSLFPGYQLFVSHSQGILETNEIKGLNNVQVTVSGANGKVLETYINSTTSGGIVGNGYYQPVSKFVATPGQTYTLTASAPGFETVTSTLTLPGKVNGLQATYVKKTDLPFGETGKVTITLPDDGNEQNFYLLYGQLLDNRYVANNRDVFYEQTQDENGDVITTDFNDIHFTNSNDRGNVFSDEGINGRTITLSRDVIFYIGDAVKRPKYLRLLLHSVTRDTYRFLKSSESYEENYNNPFAEPTRVIGNLENGYGYFGGYTSTYIDIPL